VLQYAAVFVAVCGMCVAACCSVSVMYSVTRFMCGVAQIICAVLQSVAVGVLQCVAVGVLQRAAVGVLQRVAVCCSALQCAAVCGTWSLDACVK